MQVDNRWEVVIGLEVHAQIISQTKLFSQAAADCFGAEPNSQVSFIDAGFPGMLPTLNRECVVQGLRTALALKAKVQTHSVFERKNYFYPDLPAGYQISQYQHPLALDGSIILDLPAGGSTQIGITRIHLEMDTGKSLHDQSKEYSYIDLNRSGVGLMEIVSAPDLRSPEQAGAYLHKLRMILRYLGVCDGNMEEGSLRCDANVSVRQLGAELGTRCEIKNLNSIRFLQQALRYESQRQCAILEQSGRVEQETLLWDQSACETRPMRGKEQAHDYRYFPDPDLPPLVLDPNLIEEVERNLPELPDQKKERFVTDYGLSPAQAGVLVAERAPAQSFERVISALADTGTVANVDKVIEAHPVDLDDRRELARQVGYFVTGEWFAALNKRGLQWSQNPVTENQVIELLQLRFGRTISARQAKDVLEEMFESRQGAAEIVQARGWRQISDRDALGFVVEEVLSAHSDQLARYKAGKDKLFGFFVGQVMKRTQGQADPALVNRLLREHLDHQK